MINRVSNSDITQAFTKASIEAEDAKIASFREALEKSQNDLNIEEIKEASDAFETYFIHLMLKEMRKSVNAFSSREKSMAENTFEEMFDEEIAELATKAGGIGVSDFLVRELTRSYEQTGELEELE